MKRTLNAIHPTARRKREKRRINGPTPEREPRPQTLDEMALDLVDRGLASRAILGPRKQRRNGGRS